MCIFLVLRVALLMTVPVVWGAEEKKHVMSEHVVAITDSVPSAPSTIQIHAPDLAKVIVFFKNERLKAHATSFCESQTPERLQGLNQVLQKSVQGTDSKDFNTLIDGIRQHSQVMNKQNSDNYKQLSRIKVQNIRRNSGEYVGGVICALGCTVVIFGTATLLGTAASGCLF